MSLLRFPLRNQSECRFAAFQKTKWKTTLDEGAEGFLYFFFLVEELLLLLEYREDL